MAGHKLLVHIMRAEGLQHMNHFTGDQPYCVCEVKHADSHSSPTKAETKPVTTGDTLNPIWDEAFEIDPWHEGEPLEFTIYDKGLLGKKTEGKVLLAAHEFFPNGFNGMLSISEIRGAFLQVEVQILGAQSEQVVPTMMTSMAGEVPMAAYTAPSTAYTYDAPPAPAYSTQTVTYGAAPAPAYPTQTVTYSQGPHVMYQAAAPAAAPMTYAASSAMMAPAPTTYSVSAPLTYGVPQSQPMMVQGAQACAGVASPMVSTGPQKLAVSILQAHGLQHMNNFTGDHPYCTCEVKHMHHHAGTTRMETKTVTEGDTLNPFWGETHHLEPWHPGESLEFTVYDKGLIGSKTEGKILLPSDFFFPQGFSGMLQIAGLPHALLHVIVRPLGQSGGSMMAAGAVTEVAPTTVEGATKAKKKKLKVGKKSKGCC